MKLNNFWSLSFSDSFIWLSFLLFDRLFKTKTKNPFELLLLLLLENKEELFFKLLLLKEAVLSILFELFWLLNENWLPNYGGFYNVNILLLFKFILSFIPLLFNGGLAWFVFEFVLILVVFCVFFGWCVFFIIISNNINLKHFFNKW